VDTQSHVKSPDVQRLRPDAPPLLFEGTRADFGVEIAAVAVSANGSEGNGPAFMPRGNHDAWVGPSWARSKPAEPR
jgi:hypothetical protein